MMTKKKRQKKPFQTKNALLVEGGGMRGIFSAGVLDSFLESNFDPFDTYIGVSAGACNLSSHLAGQKYRNYRAYMYQMSTKGFVNVKQFIGGGHLMDLDWLWNKLDQVDPLDVGAASRFLKKTKKKFFIVGTNLTDGEANYLKPSERNWLDCLKASCALPVLYRHTPEVDGSHFLDGGVSDPIPVKFALELKARNIVIIRSRPLSYSKKASGLETRIANLMFRKDTRVQGYVARQPIRYQEAIDFLESYEGRAKIYQVAPEQPLQSGRTTKKQTKLQADYDLGRKLGLALVNNWQK